ncbi:MAG: hypothetical protein ACWGNV_02620 [Bacteroidales bacterium]
MFHVVIRGFLIFCLFCTGIGSTLTAQTATYSHPLYQMSFTASSFWNEELSQSNGQLLRVVNPNRNMEVTLSYFPGCTHPKKQLQKISGQCGLICQNASFDTLLNGRKSVLLRGVCLQGRESYRRMITGIPGKDGLYVMQICCPEECYASHRKEMEAILNSLSVGS